MNEREIKKWEKENPEMAEHLQNHHKKNLDRYNELMEKIAIRNGIRELGDDSQPSNNPLFEDDIATNNRFEINQLHEYLFGASIDDSVLDPTDDAEQYKINKIISKRKQK